MVSFMSAIHLDLDGGFGAFASINAQLGYRPNPVAQFALELLRAAKEGRAAPPLPAFDASASIADPTSYQGSIPLRRWAAPRGRRRRASASSSSAAGRESPCSMSRRTASSLIARGSTCIRCCSSARASPRTPAAARRIPWSPSPMVRTGTRAPEAGAAHRSVARARTLCRGILLRRSLGGLGACRSTPGTVMDRRDGSAHAIGDRLFRVGEKPSSPETAEFSDLVNGRRAAAAVRRCAIPPHRGGVTGASLRPIHFELPRVPDHPREIEPERIQYGLGHRLDLLLDVVLSIGRMAQVVERLRARPTS